MKQLQTISLVFIVLILLSSACKTNSDPVEDQFGKLSILFEHRIDGEPIVYDEMKYINAAGNQYLVNEIQYFISDITLHNSEGEKVFLDAWTDIHYVDSDIENTQTFALKDEIQPGNYEKVTFTFGINEQKNQSLMFVNPPESFMFWPEYLGGGYHYMKLNGKWLDDEDQVSPFNFHLGIGQDYYSFPDSITAYAQNYFEVELAAADVNIVGGQTTDISMVMNVENWFQSPNTYDHNQWGGDIMQTQDAMKLACDNGWDVFSLEK